MTRLPGGPPERLARAGVTEREAEVLSAVAERLHNREIADRLYISVRTSEIVHSSLVTLVRYGTGRTAASASGAEADLAACRAEAHGGRSTQLSEARNAT
jgi:FixJ family two-component response regulator